MEVFFLDVSDLTTCFPGFSYIFVDQKIFLYILSKTLYFFVIWLRHYSITDMFFVLWPPPLPWLFEFNDVLCRIWLGPILKAFYSSKFVAPVFKMHSPCFLHDPTTKHYLPLYSHDPGIWFDDPPHLFFSMSLVLAFGDVKLSEYAAEKKRLAF